METRNVTFRSKAFCSFNPDCTPRGLYSHYHVPPSPARIKVSAQVIHRLTATGHATFYASGYARQEQDQRRGKLIISSYHKQQEWNGQNCLVASSVHNLSYVLTLLQKQNTAFITSCDILIKSFHLLLKFSHLHILPLFVTCSFPISSVCPSCHNFSRLSSCPFSTLKQFQ